MINTRDLENYKKQLEERRKKLMAEIQGESTPHNPGNDITSDGEAEADEAESFANQLAIAQSLRDEVQEIDLALERMREGTYGTCRNCGKAIEDEVLRVAPESTLCEACKIGS